MSKVLILNKTFEGAWTEREGNIAHEIIDFIKTDNGEHYIYNNPLGQCPSDICLANNVSKYKKKRIVKYILLCSPSKMEKNETTNAFEFCNFYINYVAEIEEILHTESRSKEQDKFRETKDKIIQIIKDKDIKYNGKYLYEIYGDDDFTLLVTFKIKKMWQPRTGLVNIRTKEYKFQRNKGYIDDDNFTEDFNSIMNLIEENDKINTKIWKEVELSSLNNKTQNSYNSKTFLDLICKKDSEECYTNILQSILNHKNLLNKFCEEFDKNNTYDKSNSSFQNLVKRERSIIDGRIDISADNGNQKIIIENKIYSGLNGIHTEDKISQLSTYYAWGKENVKKNPVCFIACPNFKIKEIEFEIDDKDYQMKNKYNIVGYKEIANFIRKNLCILKEDYLYKKYVDNFVDIFINFGYENKFEYFENMFLEAINKSNSEIIFNSANKIVIDHSKAFKELAK